MRARALACLQVLDVKELEDDDLFDALRMEIMILRQLKHPCVAICAMNHPFRSAVGARAR